ncbi:hypothetical protein [Halobacteriovorax sp. HLS]|uniref:hypothetical protein n=1 Tax=Halobacteriovorax sp. HLS TaxID=2234000 RepID=UPI000FD91B0B|nr:hypothetical protein [Halobacteriovorax sp. HLS]
MAYDERQDLILDEFLSKEFGAEFFKPGLERITESFEIFNQLFKSKKTRIITVAGTNGKGETSHYLNDLLCSHGLKTALWTSPHVLSVTERFRFLGKQVEHAVLLDRFESTSHLGISFSYYEFLFYCFCEMALEYDLDYLILEVGLGGRLDTTNLLDADYTLVCSISRDHEEYLGRDLVGILHEKLGVTRQEAYHFSALESGFLRNEQHKFLTNKNTSYIDLFEMNILHKHDDFSTRNQILATTVFQKIFDREISRKEIDLLRDVNVRTVTKGRIEEVTIEKIKFIFIGAHNVDGIRKSVDLLLAKKFEQSEGLICAFSKRPIEDIRSGLKTFISAPCLWKSIYVSEFDHPKAAKVSDISNMSGLTIVNDWTNLLETIIKDNKGQWIVTGSYYFIGEVQKYLIRRFPSLEL